MNITQNEAVKNFEEIARQLVASASTEKAAHVAKKYIDAVRARGPEWILENATALRVTFVPCERSFPVADNRGFYISAMQMSLSDK